jgi:hypothetical protein
MCMVFALLLAESRLATEIAVFLGDSAIESVTNWYYTCSSIDGGSNMNRKNKRK